MGQGQNTSPRSLSDPWEGATEPPVSSKWRSFIGRLKPLCARRFQMVLLYLDQDGEPVHFRVIGKREET